MTKDKKPEFRIIKNGKVVGHLSFKGALAQYDFTDADDHPDLPEGIGPDLWCSGCTLHQLVCPDKHGKPVYAGDEVECVPLYHLRKVLPEIGIIEWCDLTFGWTIAVDKRKYALANFTTIELVQEQAHEE